MISPHVRVTAGLGVLALAASLLLGAPAHAAPGRTDLVSAACGSALVELGTAQRKAGAPKALLDRSLTACSRGALVLPKAQFAVVTDLDSSKPTPVGMVFAWTDTHAMTAPGQFAGAYLLANGTGLDQPTAQPVSLVRDHRATARFAGREYPGQLNVSSGLTNTLVVFIFDAPVGKVSKPRAHRSAVNPVPGAKVLVFSDAGAVRAALGPIYKVRQFSLDRLAFGVVTAPDGTYRGTAEEFTTKGPSGAATKAFWAQRAEFLPYQGISDTAIG